jgi:putative ABC transport system ATP-binding protein
MIYQQPNWVKALNVIENIAFPLLLLGQDRNTSLVKATVVLETVEMTGWSKYLPSELSSGQQQRIALARALVTNPEVIIADEPTGNLDYESGQKIMEILSYLNIEKKKTIVMVTHDLEYLKFAKRAVRMFNGTVVGVYNETERGNLLEQIKSKRGSEDIENVPPLTVIPAAV